MCVFVCAFEWMTTEQEFTNMEKEKNKIFDQVHAEEVDVGLKKNYCEFLNRYSIVIIFWILLSA